MINFIQRDRYLTRLIGKKENGLIKVITGIRRCGKSFLLFHLFRAYLLSHGISEEQIIAVTLDDDRFVRYRNPSELSRFIRSQITSSKMYYVFIDEVQYAISKNELQHPDEIKLYNVLNGLMRLHNVDIYVTGSNSKLLSTDVMTAFRGRGDSVELYPLSFKEYFEFSKQAAHLDKTQAFEDYALYGGMPQLLTYTRDEEKELYLKKLFSEVYFKDICDRYTVKLPEVLESLADDLCSSVGSLTNAKKIANTLATVQNNKVSVSTIAKYLTYLTDSFLFSEAKRYDVKRKKYFEYPVKYYCTDIGLRNARLNFRQQEEPHITENILYNELIARGYSVDVGIVELNESVGGNPRKKQCEIDFVVNRGSRRYYIQSALYLDTPEKLATELRPLKHTNDFFKKIIVSKTLARPWFDEDGIVHMGLYDFLLDENSLNWS